nr:major facilitator superfamily domain-containing protein 6-like [Lytechinus pictus]
MSTEIVMKSASQTLIGVLEAIQSIAELIVGYFSRRFLNYLGYITSLTLGLAVNAIRFVCYAAISNPLWLIPVEILHGISFLLTWTTLVSYLGTAVPAECMTTVQGILGVLYFGLGVGVGSLVSGIIIDYFNAVKAFYGFAVASLAVMFLFMVSQQMSRFHAGTTGGCNINTNTRKHLADIEQEVCRLISDATTKGTKTSYQRAIDSFQRFRLASMLDSSWPATPQQVMSFIAHLSLRW